MKQQSQFDKSLYRADQVRSFLGLTISNKNYQRLRRYLKNADQEKLKAWVERNLNWE